MEFTQASGELMSVGDAFITAMTGYGIVFLGMILLICVIMLVNRIIRKSQAKQSAQAEPADAEAKAPVAAPGSAGAVKLYNVSERDAAMIMAIVADELGKPLNELRFLSIKEIDPD
ncbi:MAG: OadG family protein [Oscillospiraceae bacterium]|nr:OadG family protein [Oscillospiraceae bacterium]MBO7423510.1 OadG family protein [Oscillospiraceae bacterium]MBP5239550.1 OadG family protein [Oscillospiraceae bacterium]